MISGHVHLLSILSWGILVYQTSMSFLLHFILQRGDYFLGNLIVNQKDNNVYEVIDGQQRLTTLFLLERYLGIAFANDALRFEARDKANRTLATLPDTKQLTDELQSSEIKEGYKIIDDYFEKTGLSSEKEKIIKRLDKVNLIRVQVPAKIDLNHYSLLVSI